jgi:hypothetical protein
MNAEAFRHAELDSATILERDCRCFGLSLFRDLNEAKRNGNPETISVLMIAPAAAFHSATEASGSGCGVGDPRTARIGNSPRLFVVIPFII